MSHECNKFIIKDEKFVRDFEQMYQHSSDPWDQEAKWTIEYGPNIALCALKLLVKQEGLLIGSVLDIGCASGYHAPSLMDLPSQCYVGTDVSHTIIKRAEEQNENPNVSFKSEENLIAFAPHHENQHDLVFCAGTLYYVAPEISSGLVLENIHKYCKEGGLFAHVMNFRDDSFTSQWITIPTFRHMIKDYFAEVFYSEIQMPGGETINIGIYKK